MKIDCDKLALEAIRFAGLNPERAPGLAELFKMVEREAFADGVLVARVSSFAEEPQKLYEREYTSKAATPTHRKAAPQARRARQAAAPADRGTDGQHREQEAPESALTVDAVDPVEAEGRSDQAPTPTRD